MKIKLTLLPALALAMSLAGCSSDEPGMTPVNQENGTVRYENGTSLSLTAPGDWTRGAASRAFDEDDVNGACKLFMPETGIPAVPSDAIDVTTPPEGWQEWNLGFPGTEATGWQVDYRNCVVPQGKEYTLSGAPIAKDFYVEGHLVIKGFEGKNGRLIILPGGSVDFPLADGATADDETNTSLNGVTVINYGELNFETKNLMCNGTAQLLTAKDLNIRGLINVGGNMYVGGALTCTRLDPNNGALLHVMGATTLTGDENKFNNLAEVCMEGGLHAKHLEMNSAANFHIGCGLFTDYLEMNNGMHLTTAYVQSPVTVINQCLVSMPDGGLADLGETDFKAVAQARFEVVGGGKAMINTTNCRLYEQFSLTDVVPADFYFNYEHFYVMGSNGEEVTLPGMTSDGQHEVTIGTTLINVAKPNAYVQGQCNPSFKAPDTPDTPEDPTVIPGNPDDDIILHVPSKMDRDLYLESDDFALRVDGQYIPSLKFEGNQTMIDGVSVAEKGFDVKISGLKNLEPGKEYTYELYLWVKGTTWASMSEQEKADWVKGDGDGTDITDLCELLEPQGFRVRKNVYQGLSGQHDTPYIKVSIHVEKL